MIAFSFSAVLFGDVTRTLAAGVVVGGMLQLGIQVPQLLRSGLAGFDSKIDFFPTPGIRQVAKLMVPVIFGIGIVQINVLAARSFASYLQEGSVTANLHCGPCDELVLVHMPLPFRPSFCR